MQVKDVPAEFSGSTWLPATNLTLAEAGMPPTLNLNTGDNLTRTLSLQATGLPSEALPPLPESVSDGLRSYPENPQRDTSIGPDGVTSTLTQTRALVPVEAGKLTLPAIRIPWWDTESNSEKVALIPAQTLNVISASGENNAAVPEAVSSDSQSTPPETSLDESITNAMDKTDNGHFWQWVSLALACIWMLTMLAWWRTRRTALQSPANTDSPNAGKEQAAFEHLLDAAKEGHASTLGLFVNWAGVRLPGHDFCSAGDVFRVFPDPDLEAELGKLQAHLFSRDHATGKNSTEDGEECRSAVWDSTALTQVLKQTRGKMEHGSSEAGLPPLYPSSLSVSG